MSLIHDALKKVEQGRRPGGAKAGVPDAAAYQSRGGRARRLVVVLSGVGAIVASVITAAYVFNSPIEDARPILVKKTAENAVATPDRNAKGVSLYREGRFGDALAEFNSALAQNPGDGAAHNNAGLAAMSLGDTKDAESHFKEAIRLRPEYPEALNNYGALLDGMGRSDMAVELFARALTAEPAYEDAELNLAIALDRLGKRGEAASHYERFLQTGRDAGRGAEVRSRLTRLRADGLVKGRKAAQDIF
ncbi:MAG: tetratricopeptide repeat protein [Deltaproteobacteria bacterium]|nr:tetratricopeptide repeat protein [Deltaproteobacteria bacterium]